MNPKKKKGKDLNKLINNKDEEQNQNVLNEDTAAYVIEDRTKELDEPPDFDLTDEQLKELDAEDDDLTEEQLKGLEEAIKEDDRGETISWEEFKNELDQWRSKL